MKFKVSKLTIYDLTTAGIFLTVIAVVKFFDIVVPKAPIGVAWWEIYWTVGCIVVLFLPLIPSFFVLLLSPFLWFATGQTTFISPISFIFDYTLPMFYLLIVKLSKNKYVVLCLIILAGILKYFSHVISGYLFYETGWEVSFVLNAPYVFTTISITILLVLLFFKRIKMLREYSLSKLKIGY